MRKTKIIATIGPASRGQAVLDQLFRAGMDCARLNFSHGTLEEHAEVIRSLRQLSEAHQRPITVLQDLGGTKLRLGQVNGTFRLNVGDVVALVPESRSTRQDILPFPHPNTLNNLKVGDLVYISDGTICLEVKEVLGSAVRARVINGGILSSFKGVNLPGVEIDQPVLTDADKVALKFGVEQKVDWVAVSFVQTAQDIRDVRQELDSHRVQTPIMAKLERAKAIENLDSILREANGVMVARGDLGIEIPMTRVPIIQKEIVRKANELARVSVIATQMLRSMLVSPMPTRAEISDITTAVLDGCDAILLSDETAIGEYPVEALKVADATIQEAESIYPYYKDLPTHDRTQAIAKEAGDLVRVLKSKPIVLTSTGRAAFEVSRFRPNSNIIVFSHDEAILRRVRLGWGLAPMGVIPPERDTAKLVALIIKAALKTGMVSPTDVVTIVHGFLTGVTGTTNTIQVLDLKEYLSAVSGP